MASFPGNKRSRKYYKGKAGWKDDSNNMLDYKQWVVGTNGAQGDFVSQGQALESEIIKGYDHFGEKDSIWKCIPNGSSGWDGGWVHNSLPHDHTKAYRLIFISRRTGTTNGGSYFWMGSDVDVRNLAGVSESVPYIYSGTSIVNCGWVITTGYLFGSDYAGLLSRGNTRRIDSGENLQASTSYKSDAAATTIIHRCGLNGVTVHTGNRQYFARPRMEPINGSEPPLATIYASLMTFTADFTEEIVTGADGSENILYVQASSYPPMSDGDYWIDYSTGENRVFWMNGANLLELEPYIPDSFPSAPNTLSVSATDKSYQSISNSGKRLTRNIGPHKFTAQIGYPVQTKDQFGKIDAFLTKMRNSGDPFFLTLPIKENPDGATYAFVSGAGQSGYALNLDGMVKEYNPVGIKAGQYLKIEGSDKIYMASEDMTVDYLGTGTVQLSQRLQFTPADNADVFLVNPEIKVDLVSVNRFDVQPPELYSYQIEVEEVIE